MEQELRERMWLIAQRGKPVASRVWKGVCWPWGWGVGHHLTWCEGDDEDEIFR